MSNQPAECSQAAVHVTNSAADSQVSPMYSDISSDISTADDQELHMLSPVYSDISSAEFTADDQELLSPVYSDISSVEPTTDEMVSSVYSDISLSGSPAGSTDSRLSTEEEMEGLEEGHNLVIPLFSPDTDSNEGEMDITFPNFESPTIPHILDVAQDLPTGIRQEGSLATPDILEEALDLQFTYTPRRVPHQWSTYSPQHPMPDPLADPMNRQRNIIIPGSVVPRPPALPQIEVLMSRPYPEHSQGLLRICTDETCQRNVWVNRHCCWRHYQ